MGNNYSVSHIAQGASSRHLFKIKGVAYRIKVIVVIKRDTVVDISVGNYFFIDPIGITSRKKSSCKKDYQKI